MNVKGDCDIMFSQVAVQKPHVQPLTIEEATSLDIEGTRWNSFDFTDGQVGMLTGIWEFDFNDGIRDPACWNGKWKPITYSNHRIKIYLYDGENIAHVYELIFLNDDWFVALENNKLLRLGQRIR